MRTKPLAKKTTCQKKRLAKKNDLPKNDLPKTDLPKNDLPKKRLAKNDLPKTNTTIPTMFKVEWRPFSHAFHHQKILMDARRASRDVAIVNCGSAFIAKLVDSSHTLNTHLRQMQALWNLNTPSDAKSLLIKLQSWKLPDFLDAFFL